MLATAAGDKPQLYERDYLSSPFQLDPGTIPHCLRQK